MKQLEGLVARVEKWKALDRMAEPLARAVGRAVRPAPVRSVLSGTVIGHPLHPLLTDVPIGAWTVAAVLDLAGGPSTARAADVLVAAGLAAAVPTAATGLNDWADTQGADRRIDLVNATANSVALTFYTASLAARLGGRCGAGTALAPAGYGCVMSGGYLGGHLVFVRGVNVNRTAWRRGPRRWTDVLADADLPAGGHRRPSRSPAMRPASRRGGSRSGAGPRQPGLRTEPPGLRTRPPGFRTRPPGSGCARAPVLATAGLRP